MPVEGVVQVLPRPRHHVVGDGERQVPTPLSKLHLNDASRSKVEDQDIEAK